MFFSLSLACILVEKFFVDSSKRGTQHRASNLTFIYKFLFLRFYAVFVVVDVRFVSVHFIRPSSSRLNVSLLIFFIKQHKCTMESSVCVCVETPVRNLYQWELKTERDVCCIRAHCCYTAKDSFGSELDIFFVLFRCWIWEIGFFWCRCWCCCYLVCTGCRTRLLMTKLSRWPIVTYPQWIAPVCVCVQCAHRIVPFFFKQQTATTTTTNFWWNALIRNKSSKKSFTFSLPRHRFILYFIFSLFHSPHSVQLTSLIFLFFPPQCRFVKVCCCVCVLFLFLSHSFLLIEAYSKIRKWANSYDTC